METLVEQLVNQVRLLTVNAQAQGDALREMERLRASDLQKIVEYQAQLINQRMTGSRASFVDVQGIGKPAVFASEQKQFGAW